MPITNSLQTPVPLSDAEMRRKAERDIEDWAAGARHSIKSRREYNHQICDMLAGAGIPPLAATVTRIGSWGQTGSVKEDVASWYARLKDRLNGEQAQLPLAARQQANGLLEGLWRLATLELEQRIAEPLRQELDAKQALLNSAVSRFAGLEARYQSQTEETSAALTRINTLEADLVESQTAITLATSNFEFENATLESELVAQRIRAEESLRNAAERHSAKVTDLQSRLDVSATGADQERRSMLVRIDGHQVQIKQLSVVAEKAQTSLTDALQKISNLRVELAATQGRESLLNSELVHRSKSLDEAKQGLLDQKLAFQREGEQSVLRFVANLASLGMGLVSNTTDGSQCVRPNWVPEEVWSVLRAQLQPPVAHPIDE